MRTPSLSRTPRLRRQTMCVRTCARRLVHVCAFVWERKRDRDIVRVCVWERQRVCVKKHMCVCVSKRVCLCGKVRVWVSVSVCVRVLKCVHRPRFAQGGSEGRSKNCEITLKFGGRLQQLLANTVRPCASDPLLIELRLKMIGRLGTTTLSCCHWKIKYKKSAPISLLHTKNTCTSWSMDERERGAVQF